MTPTVGFLGTGHLASYTVRALRNGGHEGRIILSPRNASIAAKIAQTQGCDIAVDNQSVVSSAEIVVLSVRPHQLDELLDDLRFSPDQILLSAVAATPVAELASRCTPCRSVHRIMPSSFIEAGDALFPVFPANKTIGRLFGACGKVVVFETEQQFELSMIASCAYAWVYDLMDEMVDWFTRAGWPETLARDMVVRHVRGATTFALTNPEMSLADISAGIATDGTFTKTGLEQLKDEGAFSAWNNALSLLASKVGNGA